MEDYLKRVIDEQKELQIKLDKLIDFLLKAECNPQIDRAEKDRLKYQLSSMDCYNEALLRRIGKAYTENKL